MNSEVLYTLSRENPTLADASDIAIRFGQFLEGHGIIDDRFLEEFGLAIAEGLNNAVEHGCRGRIGARISASLAIRHDHAEVRIEDPSSFEGWREDPGLPEDPLSDSGRGGFLMVSMADSVSHESKEGRHVLVLRKELGPLASLYEPGLNDSILAAMTEELGASFEMINALIGLGQLLAGAEEMETFVSAALARTCEITGAEVAYVRMDDGQSLRLEGMAGQMLDPARFEHSLPLEGNSVEIQAFRSGEEVTITETLRDEPLSRVLDSGFVAPIFYKEEHRGVLVIGRQKASSFFNAGQIAVARMVAEYFGIIFAMNDLQKRRAEDMRSLRDLEIAAEIQLSLMPQAFDGFVDIDMYGSCLPAQRAGGDYFDTVSLADGSLLIFIADVMGKGVPAALLAAMIRTNLNALGALAARPDSILQKINDLMIRDLINLDIFITAACGWISSDRRTLHLANAGHPPPLLHRQGAGVRRLQVHGLPIGVLSDLECECESFDLDRDDYLLFYTDGFIDAASPEGVTLDIDGLSNALEKRSAEKSARNVANELFRLTSKWTGRGVTDDDRTLVVAIPKP